jgi:glucose/mannose transport system substrate-binding protein
MTTFRTTAPVAAILCVGLAGCGGAEAGGGTPRTGVVEYYSSMAAGPDAQAEATLVDAFHERFPQVQCLNQAGVRAVDWVTEIEWSMADSRGPDTFLWWGGRMMRRWTDRSVLAPLDGLAIEERWASTMHPSVLEAASRGGHLFAVPLLVGRSNVLFFDRNVLRANGVEPPSTIGAFLTAAEVLKAKGVTPLAMSTSDSWTTQTFLFDDVLLAQSGPIFYDAYLHGRAVPDAVEMQNALATLLRVLDVANADRMRTSWNDSIAKVCSGKAAMTYLGDYAASEFARLGCGPERVGYVAVEPAGTPTFAFDVMAWPQPVHAQNPRDGIEFLRVLGDRDAQSKFARALTFGTIPARVDVDPFAFDAIRAQTIRDYVSPATTLVLDAASLLPKEMIDPLDVALRDFIDPSSPSFRNVETVLAVLRDTYSLLQK